VSGQAFDSAGAVTFSNINGLTLLSSAPQTLLLVFNLNMAGLTDRTFNNAIDSASIVASGWTTGEMATVSGGVVTGATHTVRAATPTPSHTTTHTPTETPTHTTTHTVTHTPTETPTTTATPTVTPRPRSILSLSAQAPVRPSAQTYTFGQTNVSSVQIILTAQLPRASW